MESAKQLKLQPAELELLTPSEYRYYIVQTIENSDGRAMSLLSKCKTDGEAHQEASNIFLEMKVQHPDVAFGIGIVDVEQPGYMLACRFASGKPGKH